MCFCPQGLGHLIHQSQALAVVSRKLETDCGGSEILREGNEWIVCLLLALFATLDCTHRRPDNLISSLLLPWTLDATCSHIKGPSNKWLQQTLLQARLG